MTHPDYRALCAELAEALDAWQLGGGPPEDDADQRLIARARAALAEPADCNYPGCVDDLPDEKCVRWPTGDCLGPKASTAKAGPAPDYSRVSEIATEAQIRAAAQYLVKKQNCDGDLIPAIRYAIARWGSAPCPVPMADKPWKRGSITHPLADRARAALAAEAVERLPDGARVVEPTERTVLVPVPRPIPVSDRLPGPEDCDAEGRCWFYSARWKTWSLETVPEKVPAACSAWWLPAHALPIPTQEKADG